MKNEITTTTQLDTAALANLILKGDLKALSPEQKVQYYTSVCERVGLDPVARPFAYMTLSGREVLYCDKGGAEQLRKLHKVSLKITDRQKIEDVCVVTCEATLPDGRCDASTGAVSIAGLKGDAMANALMKAETKAKRRATLSILGLGMLDESELETIPAASKGEIKAPVQVQAKAQAEAQKPEYEAFNTLASEASQEQPQTAEDLGEFVMPIGKEHKGKKLKEIPISKLEGFTTWLQQKNAEKPLTGEVLTTLNILESYISQLKYLPEA